MSDPIIWAGSLAELPAAVADNPFVRFEIRRPLAGPVLTVGRSAVLPRASHTGIPGYVGVGDGADLARLFIAALSSAAPSSAPPSCAPPSSAPPSSAPVFAAPAFAAQPAAALPSAASSGATSSPAASSAPVGWALTYPRSQAAPVEDVLGPASDSRSGGGDWDWLWTDAPPPRQPAEHRVVGLDDADDAADLIRLNAEHSPTAESEPGSGRTEVWLGIRDRAGSIIAAGAIHRTAAGAPHLCGIVVDAAHRGQGLGAAITAALTRRALSLSGDTSVATLSVYAGNTGARRMYQQLGYHTAQAFRSRLMTPPSPDVAMLGSAKGQPAGAYP